MTELLLGAVGVLILLSSAQLFALGHLWRRLETLPAPAAPDLSALEDVNRRVGLGLALTRAMYRHFEAVEASPPAAIAEATPPDDRAPAVTRDTHGHRPGRALMRAVRAAQIARRQG
jgi:hypothetical protein